MELCNELAASQFSIRTSDRRTFRRCMRKWDLQSSLRQNLRQAGTEQNINFWFGSAIHFCMEDYHGYNKFEDPRRALYAYYHAFKDDDKPIGAEMHYSLGLSMLTYYLTWMKRHNQQPQFETAWLKEGTFEPVEPGTPGAQPAVEIPFYIPLHTYAIVDAFTNKIIDAFYYDGIESKKPLEVPHDWKPENPPDTVYYTSSEYPDEAIRIVEIFYHGTIDRIVKDRYGRYWLWDYKTAKRADTGKLATDDQVSAYLWAAQKIFPFKVYGFVYLQMVKERIQEPRRLKDGSLSVDKRQKTTYSLLRQEIINEFGEVNKAPSKLIQFLNYIAETEEPEGDRFIRWDFVKRTAEQLANTERAIYGEMRIMLDSQLYCYPSPTRDCVWDCPFREACIMLDMNDREAYSEFMRGFEARPHEEDGNEDDWRQHIEWPKYDENGQPILVSMQEVAEYDAALVIAEPDAEDVPSAFEFYYEEEC